MKDSNRNLFIMFYTFMFFFIGAHPSSAQEWYSGGTLHKGNGKNWQAATPQNRLATAADFTAGALPVFVSKHIGESNEFVFKLRAAQLVVCLNSATSDPPTDGTEIATIAALCMVSMKWKDD